jgi:hypothetical protein
MASATKAAMIVRIRFGRSHRRHPVDPVDPVDPEDPVGPDRDGLAGGPGSHPPPPPDRGGGWLGHADPPAPAPAPAEPDAEPDAALPRPLLRVSSGVELPWLGVKLGRGRGPAAGWFGSSSRYQSPGQFPLIATTVRP